MTKELNIKNKFSIKDLESLSGIKAHTIRIWEKRYGLLKPSRTATNIRYYDLDSLQKILNISLLNGYGLKVSKIAELNNKELQNKVLEIFEEDTDMSIHISELKVAMLTFQVDKFNETYTYLSNKYDFDDIFLEVFVPLLKEVGLLWQTNTIAPVHERFLSNLIKQKILASIENISINSVPSGNVHVLFLPENESHDIGLLYIYYSLLRAGKRTIYLGANVPVSNLKHVQLLHDDIIFISYLTVSPELSNFVEFFDDLQKDVLSEGKCVLHVSGRMANQMEYKTGSDKIIFHATIENIITALSDQ